MNAQDRLIRWHFTWQISKTVVSCRACHASQSENDRSSPFQHGHGCASALASLNPWVELDSIGRASPATLNASKARFD
jgi:predicted metal-binding protein